MTYAIGFIIYGFPLQTEGAWEDEDILKVKAPFKGFDEIIEVLEDEELVVRHYSGGDGFPDYIGVELFQFDECSIFPAANFVLVPTEEQVQEFNDNLEKVLRHPACTDEFVAKLKAQTPIVFVTWGSS